MTQTIATTTAPTFADACEAKRVALVTFRGYRDLNVTIRRNGTAYVVTVTATAD